MAGQTFRDYELIVVDGKSGDRTAEIIKGFGGLVTRFISEPDGGIYDAMNKGIGMAGGEYLLFLNGGDYLYDPRVLGQVFAEPPRADILYGDMMFEAGGRRTLWSLAQVRADRDYILGTSLPHPASFIRRRLFLEHGPYDRSYKFAADHAFFMRELVRHRATAGYRPVTVAVADAGGISCDPKNRRAVEREQARARSECLSRGQALKWLLLHGPAYQTYQRIKKALSRHG